MANRPRTSAVGDQHGPGAHISAGDVSRQIRQIPVLSHRLAAFGAADLAEVFVQGQQAGGGAEGEGGHEAAPVPEPAGGDHGNVDGVGALRHQE